MNEFGKGYVLVVVGAGYLFWLMHESEVLHAINFLAHECILLGLLCLTKRSAPLLILFVLVHPIDYEHEAQWLDTFHHFAGLTLLESCCWTIMAGLMYELK